HAKLRVELLARLAALGEESGAEAPSPRVIAALEDWLATPSAPATDARARRILLALAVLLLALAVGLAFVHVAFLALALLALVAFLGSKAAATSGGRTRADHEADYQRTAEPRPVAWNEDSVRARLEELRTRLARAKDAEQRAERRRELEGNQAALESDATDLARRRAVLASRLGTTVTAPDGFLVDTARARRELREARDGLRASSTTLETRSRVRAEVLAKLNGCLRVLEVPDVADHAAAKSCVAG